MNDRFRFRVWNEKERRFIADHKYPIGSDYFLALNAEGKLLKIGIGDFNELGQYSWGSVENYKGIIEQCTGLKDKNGRLIYEGDFLINHDGNIGFIEFKNACFMLTAINEDNIMSTEDWTTCEVIGNTHEPPELLEESRETNN